MVPPARGANTTPGGTDDGTGWKTAHLTIAAPPVGDAAHGVGAEQLAAAAVGGAGASVGVQGVVQRTATDAASSRREQAQRLAAAVVLFTRVLAGI